ncbi:arrestin domain-containing protein 1-like [Acanthaster planci]|uniref:Arrestin domain-containing protein 1-like n=1 Tax=Acanthaster planci TaxID=133434 RepID=A0A8B7YVH5_ACAPL|nr:arrestin domain-containing protein 1-like [Acanthaster planci]
MGKITNLAIIFNGDVDVFSPGDIIKGQVILQIESATERGLENVKGIWLQFRGESRIEIKRNNQLRDVLDEGYFDTTQVLFGTGTETPDVKNLNVPSGQQVFPFAIRLPDDRLPAAFEEQLGYVRYKVKATISLIRYLRNKEYKTERYFSVIGPKVDLNSMSGLQIPVTCDVTSRGWFGCGPPVSTITLNLPKQGYVPGESINITGRVDNQSGSDQFSIRVKLIQEVNFLFTNCTTSIERVLAKIDSKLVCPKRKVSHLSVGPLRIPPVPPSGLPGCSLINIEYFILCKDRKFPLKIGTVPLRPAGGKRRQRAPVATGGQLAPDQDTDDDAPPRYEEVVSVTDRLAYEISKDDFFSGGEFFPRYPYFERTGDLAVVSHLKNL